MKNRFWAVDILGLAFAEVIVWASLFYSFPATLIEWHVHFGWSISNISISLSIALVVSGVGGILSGRVIDLGFARSLMTISSVIGGLLLVAIPLVTEIWQFHLIWSLLGLAMSGCLYQPCFSFLIKKYGTDARRGIILITLVAGLAGTFCFPASNFIITNYDWETSMYFFGLLTMLGATPLFWISVNNNRDQSQIIENVTNQSTVNVLRPVLSSPAFWGITLAFGLLALNHIMITSHILPLIQSRGISPSEAVIAASFIGVAQVIGRLGLSILGGRVSVNSISVICFVVVSISSLCFLAITQSQIFLGISIILQGIAWGILGVVKPLIIADILGRNNIGIISASSDMFYRFGYALAPASAGFISSASGYTGVLYVTFSCALLGAIIMLPLIRISKKALMT